MTEKQASIIIPLIIIVAILLIIGGVTMCIISGDATWLWLTVIGVIFFAAG